jgi:hypothetical protein
MPTAPTKSRVLPTAVDQANSTVIPATKQTNPRRKPPAASRRTRRDLTTRVCDQEPRSARSSAMRVRIRVPSLNPSERAGSHPSRAHREVGSARASSPSVETLAVRIPLRRATRVPLASETEGQTVARTDIRGASNPYIWESPRARSNSQDDSAGSIPVTRSPKAHASMPVMRNGVGKGV